MNCKLKIGILTETAEDAMEIINELYKNNIDHKNVKVIYVVLLIMCVMNMFQN